VTFLDVVNGTGEGKAGYDKIRFCADQAELDGLVYFWIDTCCIDKTNSAELTEAINSMFRWYRDAFRCYAYLADVPTSNSQNWEASFRASRWFCRGWTLQELIAPTSVQFFARDGTQLGNKTNLVSQIHEITGIAVAALRGEPLARFDIEERFKWAESRQTTREEDWAYSLLGIFDIFMPPIYGEGRVNAIRRLQRELDNALQTQDEGIHQPDQPHARMSQEDRQCLRDLHLTDPRDDKRRIEQTKGGLLVESYRWVLENTDFCRWRDDPDSNLLWVKGDPGKGKTMLLCGILNQLGVSRPSALRSFFFCQATDSRLNSASAVLRGLIYLLIDQRPKLISHLRKKYDHAGKSLFEDVNAWVALTDIFTNIAQDSALDDAYIVVDALDECLVGLTELVDFIVEISARSRVKWMVSSRNRLDIEDRIELAGQKARLSLELNTESVSAAVDTYIQHKVLQLARLKNYDGTTETAVREYLSSNANSTFLWASLVCENLTKVPRWMTMTKLKSFPPGLDSVYGRIMEQICSSDEAHLYKQILAVVALVYRPLSLQELACLVEQLQDISDDIGSLREIIGLCGSFLIVQDEMIHFVHQSAKDFIVDKAFGSVFPNGMQEIHHDIYSGSLQAMSSILRRDMYSLTAPGVLIEHFQVPEPDPLAKIRYSSVHWVDHLYHATPDTREHSDAQILTFLREKYLYWLEALSLMQAMPAGVVAMAKLEKLLVRYSPDVESRVMQPNKRVDTNRR
jgi:hypothetical protein